MYIGELKVGDDERRAVLVLRETDRNTVFVKHHSGYIEEVDDFRLCRVHDPEHILGVLTEIVGTYTETLRQAYRAGRLLVRRSQTIVLSTERAVYDAIRRGDIRPQLMDDDNRRAVLAWMARYRNGERFRGQSTQDLEEQNDVERAVGGNESKG